MTEPNRTFEEEIRRALYAAGDLIIPAGDGLNKIRERAARRPPVLGWLLVCAANLWRRLVHGGRVAASEAAATTHGYSSLGLVLASARRWPRKARHALRTPSVWLRPVLATGTALVLVIGVTLSIPRLRHQVTAQLDSALGNSSGSGPNSPGGHTGVGGAQSKSATPVPTESMVAGKPFLATMPPGARCGAHDTGGAATRDVPPTLGPAVTNAVQAGTSGAVTNSANCFSSTSPSKVDWTSSLPPPPTTAPVTPPPTTPPPTTPPPTTPPPTTTPVTTPPTTPITTTSPVTSPTSTPPSTTTSPVSSSSSADSTESSEPTQTPTPGG
jgi:hypothetical protein